MQVRFSERQVGDDLAEFFRRNHRLVKRIAERVLEINPRLPLLPEAARLEVEAASGASCTRRRTMPSFCSQASSPRANQTHSFDK